MTPSPLERFKHILANCNYMVLATADPLQPWIAPVYFAYDEQWSLYFISRRDSEHAAQLRKNSNVAVAIFDSSCTPGNCDGIQLRGTALELDEFMRIAHAAKTLFSRRFHGIKMTKDYFDPSLYKGATKMRLYEIVPKQAFVVDKSQSHDYRIAVDLPVVHE